VLYEINPYKMLLLYLQKLFYDNVFLIMCLFTENWAPREDRADSSWTRATENGSLSEKVVT